MDRKPKTLHVRNGLLWPSTIHAGATVVKFLIGKRGRRIKVEHHGKSRPRHKVLTRPPRSD